MKKLKNAPWLKYSLYVLIALVVLLLILPIIKVIRSLINGTTGVLGSLGLVDSDGLKAAKEDADNAEWGYTLFKQNQTEVTISDRDLVVIAGDIYDSWGFFSKDFDTTYAAFKKCKNKHDVSALCNAFYATYKKDLLSYISPLTWTLSFRNYPTSDEYQLIHNYVSALPY